MRSCLFCFAIFLFFNLSTGFSSGYVYKGLCAFDDIDCLKKELKAYDAELNKAYLYYLAKEKNNKLKQAELLWIKYKEADCYFWGQEVQAGNFSDYISSVCLINRTITRTSELRDPVFYGECAYKSNDKNRLACLKEEIKRYNKELDRIYKSAKDKLLLNAEQAWIKFKEADCLYKEFISDFMEKETVYYACLMNRTKDRVNVSIASFNLYDWFLDSSFEEKDCSKSLKI